MHALDIENVGKKYGEYQVLDQVNLQVAQGEFLVIVGPSGCGKSTLLRIIAGLDEHSAGHLRIDGRLMDGVPPAKRGIAMVFQSYALYPHLSVADNMSLALKQERVPREEIQRRVRAAAETLALEPLLTRRPAQLSGGQRQRVAIGRAIVRQPKLFLFDEPLSNLDAALRVNTRLELAQLHRTLGATIIYVTHDQVEAMTLANRIVVMEGGSVGQVGTPAQLYNEPANLFVAGFIGSPKMNFITEDAAAPLGAATVGVRPEHLRLTQERPRWSGTVQHVEYLGADCHIIVAIKDIGKLTVRTAGEAAPAVGDTVGVTPLPGKLLRFDAAGQRLPSSIASEVMPLRAHA
ncbi:ABC transporter ATP-binding protein [Ramlibacter tataouinensis]|uniref:Candidate ABC type sugar transport system, ATP-binding component n=1 Tax=Ramlibacter tataouinensis (strain ATCC BAA-407 / DSM 14655 / LMG 21543 / TTB310) TaxID=365046 RepID=F5XW02_RAMTT|nr:ABC transporter ATP-binding protein [Ramlibacter tataouinensis]AEG94105.1 candidate ABC type sugar transport system, ATP-binding component [Ramlibacter tataouinensis TTB310]